MASLSDLFNKTSGTVSNIGKSLGSFFAPRTVADVTFPNKQSGSYNIKNRGVTLTDQDLENLKPLLFSETSDRDISKKNLESEVIINTAINRAKTYSEKWGRPVSVSEVLAMPNQYQGYGSAQYKMYSNPTDYPSQQKKKEIDSIVDSFKEKAKTGSYEDITGGAHYYVHNPDKTITYDNTKKLFAD